MELQRLLGALCAGLMLVPLQAKAAEQSSYVTPVVGPMNMAAFAGTLNSGLRALASCSWGATAPTNGPGGAPLPYQCWADTTTNPVVFKRYDGASWAIEGRLDTATHLWTPAYQGTALGTASTATTGTSGHTVPFLDGANSWSGVNTFNTPTITGGTHTGSTALGIRSTGASFDVRFAATEVLTADRTLTWVLGDANRSITLGGNVALGGAFTMSGAFGFTGTLTGATTVTFPTTGTLATIAGAETLTTKTINCANNTCTVRLGSDVTGQLPVASGGTACTAASGTCLDNITGFASTGYQSRTGAGAYSFNTAATNANYLAGTASKVVESGVIYQAEVPITFAAAQTIDFSTFINASITLTGNMTSMTLANVTAGKAGQIRLIQDATGSRLFSGTWPTAFKWSGGLLPSLSTVPNAVDALMFNCISASYCVTSLVKDVR